MKARSNCFLQRWHVRGGIGWKQQRVSIRSVWPAMLSTRLSMTNQWAAAAGRSNHSASPRLSTSVCDPLYWKSTTASLYVFSTDSQLLARPFLFQYSDISLVIRLHIVLKTSLSSISHMRAANAPVLWTTQLLDIMSSAHSLPVAMSLTVGLFFYKTEWRHGIIEHVYGPYGCHKSSG